MLRYGIVYTGSGRSGSGKSRLYHADGQAGSADCGRHLVIDPKYLVPKFKFACKASSESFMDGRIRIPSQDVRYRLDQTCSDFVPARLLAHNRSNLDRTGPLNIFRRFTSGSEEVP